MGNANDDQNYFDNEEDFSEYINDIELGYLNNRKPISSEKAINPLDDRDRTYTELIEAYKDFYEEKSKANIELRKRFFDCSFALLFILVIGMIAVSVVLCIMVENVIAVGAGIVASISASVTSMLLLPRIIGDYLFPKNEDAALTNLMYQMRLADEGRRNNIQDFKDSDK